VLFVILGDLLLFAILSLLGGGFEPVNFFSANASPLEEHIIEFESEGITPIVIKILSLTSSLIIKWHRMWPCGAQWQRINQSPCSAMFLFLVAFPSDHFAPIALFG